MKFNYFKQAKENGHSYLAFKFAKILKSEYGERRYMAAHWLAWAYDFQKNGQYQYSRENIKSFLEEIARICNT